MLVPLRAFAVAADVAQPVGVRAVLRHLDLDPAEWIEHVADRPNHDRRYLIDPSKLERELGWRPEHEFESGLAETVRWYVDNRVWWEGVLAAKGNLQVDWSSR